METKRLAELLRHVSFSADLPDEVVRELAKISRTVSFPAGAILFEEGAQIRDIYVIWSGRVALDVHVPEHGNIRILCLGPGDLVGCSTVLDQGEMTASAAAIEATETVALPADKLLAMCEKDNRLGYEMMRRMAQQLDRRLLATRLELLEIIAQPTALPVRCTNEPRSTRSPR